MKLSFYGGSSGEVTGSNYLLENDRGDQLLVDFGLFQGAKEIVDQNYNQLPYHPSEIAGVILTHAHLDHCGRLPMLVFGGFQNKIYMTPPSAKLVDVTLNDAARVGRENSKMGRPALYGIDQVEKTLEMIETTEYDQPLTIKNFQVTFRNAGHILGSAIIEIVDTVSGKKIVFSGDLGNYPEDLIPTAYMVDKADVVVMESTYGNKIHPKEDPSQIITEEINAIEKNKGVLMIPAFSLERTQELLHRLHHLKKDKKILGHTPVFLDSPMAIHATSIFRAYRPYYNAELMSHTDDPFSFEDLVVTEDAKDSKKIKRINEAKVIIAGSGMMSGGRIMHHALQYLAKDNTRILFVGYQAEDTTGREILDGAKSVIIDDKRVAVRAHIREIQSLSSHADQPKLLNWLKHMQGVKKVLLTHGEQEGRLGLSQKIKSDLGINDVVLPETGQTVEF